MRSVTWGWIGGSLLALTVCVGCKKSDEAESGGSESGSGETAAASGSSGGGASESGDLPTGGGVVTTTEDPDGGTGGEPVACDAPEACTAMEEGDLVNATVPFFRGKACVSDQVRPGDMLTIAVSTCLHPCLAADSFAFKWAHRDDGHLALALYHEGVSGAACPADVFGMFDPALCEFAGPVQLSIAPPMKEGAGSLLLPFLTNTDAAALAGGESGAQLWARVDAHAQAPERSVAINYAAGNAAPPPTCAEGTAGCTCVDVLLE